VGLERHLHLVGADSDTSGSGPVLWWTAERRIDESSEGRQSCLKVGSLNGLPSYRSTWS
jgi:hypothetical protein